MLILSLPASSSTYSIPEDTLIAKNIFWGDGSGFDKPAEVDYNKVVIETPEYKSIKKKKVKSGTAKYWILMSEASDRAIKVICEFGNNSEYDLIAETGYLSGLDPPIECDSITKLVIKQLKQVE